MYKQRQYGIGEYIVTLFFFTIINIFIYTSLYGQTFTKITTGIAVNDGGNSFGCSWIDYNNDGSLDLFVTNYLDQNNFLYLNNQDDNFLKIYNTSVVSDKGNSISCSWGDYDNDGDPDLFVTNYEQNNLLYRNDGEYGFTKIDDGDIVNDINNSMSCSWGDFNNDGNLDLFVTNYAENNCLYHNNGDGTFVKVVAGDVVNDEGNSTGCSWGDYDNDGDLDLFVANWEQDNFLYRNRGNGTFRRIEDGNIVSDGGNSISCSWGDYDNDGDLDLVVTNWGQNNFLYKNNGNRTFSKITTDPIVTDHGFSCSSSWCDYDNDGDLDLFVADWIHKNCLFDNNGSGSFTKISTGEVVSDRGYSVGSSWGDYNNDGHPDLFVTNDGKQNNFLYLNNGNDNNWLNIKCLGNTSNSSAIGTKIRVKATIDDVPVWQMQEISGQTGYAGQNSLNAEFGLADAAVVDSIQIEWPGRIVQVIKNIYANQFLEVPEPSTFIKISTEEAYPQDTVYVSVDIQFSHYFGSNSAECNIGGYFGKLDFIEVETGSSLIGDAGWIYQSNEMDSANNIWLAGSEEISGAGVFFRLKFFVPDTASGFIPITLNSASFNTGNIPVTLVSGGINVLESHQHEDITGVVENQTEIPKEYSLSQNYPNPFSVSGGIVNSGATSTTINYSLEQPGSVQLFIFNERGRLVRTLENTTRPFGVSSATWDGRNENGDLVSSGIYFYTLRVEKNILFTKKMIVIK